MVDNKISKKRVLVNSLSGAATLAINVFFVFWLYQYLLARVPADEFAIYPVLMVIMMLAPVITSFFASAISREIIIAYSENRRDDVLGLHSSTVLALAGFLTVLAGIGALAATQIEHLISVPEDFLSQVRPMVVVIVLDLCLVLFGIPFSVAFEVRQRFVWRDGINLTSNILKIGLTFLLLFGLGPRVIWVPVASLAANLLAVAGIIICARRMMPEFRIRLDHFSLEKLRSILGFGAWTSLGTFSVLIMQSTGPVLLNLLSNPIQVSVYFIGSVFDRRVNSLMTVALAPVQPVMIEMSATGDFSRLGNAYLRGGRYALWVAMAVACPMFIYADDFIALYLGPEYSDTAIVMRVFFAIFPLIYSDVLLSRIAISTGQVRGFFTGAIVTSLAILTVTSAGLVIFDFGAVGAAVVSAGINGLAHLLFFWPLGLRLAQVRFGDFVRRVLLRGLAPSIGGLLIWLPTEVSGLSQSWLGFFVCGALGMLLYILTAIVFCLMPDEKIALRKGWARFRETPV